MKTKTKLYDNNRPIATCYTSENIGAIIHQGETFVFDRTVVGGLNEPGFDKFVKVKTFKMKRK